MKQVTQTLRTGLVAIADVPVPTLSDSFVLVKNSASIISAGTEKTKIDMGKKSLYQKAKARPDLVKQVLQKLQNEGFKKTLQTVTSRLNSPSPLGYSCSGTVVSTGGLVEGLQPGDRVACGGAGFANHADFVAVPKNLIVKVPNKVSDEEAAFATVGAIAMQGLRLAEPKLGEIFLVLGLGLLGQITVQLLRANGCTVIATDLDPALVSKAEGYGAIGVCDNVKSVCNELTSSYGVDGVLVCAGTSSNQPIELCGEVTREKGRVVVVGAIRMDIPREDFFKKEINVVISRSYGPGRYDPDYEENGNDYPLAYVRFTEQRNMKSFLELIDQGKVDVKSLITHRYKIEDAASAYNIIEGKKIEPYLGIILSYEEVTSTVHQPRIEVNTHPLNTDKVGISFYGAGNYATASLLPPLGSIEDVVFRGLVTASGRTALGVAKQFGFAFCAEEYNDILSNDTDAVMVATRHDTHASAVVDAIKANKHVYVEKPIALNIEELSEIYKAKIKNSSTDDDNINKNIQVMVGFNRRFAPLTIEAKKHFLEVKSPLVVNIRVNSGAIPKDHWIQDPNIGGGRIIGEGCHFVDLASALVDSNPKSVTCVGTAKGDKSALLNDNILISLTFQNGSIANIVYTAEGNKSMEKERIEVFGGGRSAVINDFKEATFYKDGSKPKSIKLRTQDKGQKAMLNSWVSGLRSGEPCVPFESLVANSMATILAVESLALGVGLPVDLSVLNNN